jgi:hypothetical protein
MKGKLNNKKIIITLSINLVLLIAFIGTIITLTNENGIFNLTGFTFADFYQDEVIYILDAISFEETTFVIPVKNNKESQLKEVHAIIEIYDINNSLIKELQTEKVELKPKDQKELSIKWHNNLYPGIYQAIVYISSEESNVRFIKEFEIKKKTITIESVFVNDFKLNKVVLLEILIKNHLNNSIKNLSSSLLIYDEKEEIIANLYSEEVELNNKSLQKLNIVWDTKDTIPGVYNATILSKGEDYLAQKDLILTIEDNSMTVSGIGFAIKSLAVNDINKKGEIKNIIIIFIILILLVNIVLWRIFLKKHKIKKS